MHVYCPNTHRVFIGYLVNSPLVESPISSPTGGSKWLDDIRKAGRVTAFIVSLEKQMWMSVWAHYTCAPKGPHASTLEEVSSASVLSVPRAVATSAM